MGEVERYTLEEAKVELARRDCREWGHDFCVWEQAIIPLCSTRDVPPLGVQCVRCERLWTFNDAPALIAQPARAGAAEGGTR